MAPRSILTEANQATNGQVRRALRRWRAAGLPATEMTRKLHAMGIQADESTVRRYLRNL